MDRKKANYLLIVALTIIWTLVGYKFLSPYFAKKESVLTAEMLPKNNNPILKKRDTFVLSFPERDPFLKKQIRPLKKVKPQKTKKPATNLRPKDITQPWPEIRYFGFVKSKTNSNKLGLLRIAGKLHRVKENNDVEGLRVLKILPGEIVLKNGRERKTFTKN